MGNVLKFQPKQVKEVTAPVIPGKTIRLSRLRKEKEAQSEDFRGRIERIQANLERIQTIISEIKKMEKYEPRM